ncbi:hypothetical protein CEW81_03900 [Kluyvera genomosp. 3]|uniref:Uncharacterized protein n=1 Tax=Kluyvera genomosp. 3 TaxID=2774055 RepID=A0A248KGS6_9ENTR|nr:hypothetical protein CEW81_03900 [Kluyvera genomosp. 3]
MKRTLMMMRGALAMLLLIAASGVSHYAHAGVALGRPGSFIRQGKSRSLWRSPIPTRAALI